MLPEIKYLKKIACSNFARLNFPHKISYAVTYQCNLRCKMCNIWAKKPGDELSLDQVERFFSKSNRFSWVGITGGEPFLRENIAEVARIILDRCRDLTAIHFATNGTLTNKIGESVENILGHRKRNVKLLFTLSIDGPPALHDDIRGAEGTWLKCVASFKMLRAMKSVQARIGTTLSHNNFDKFYETFLSLKEVYPLLRFDDFTINIFHRSSLYYENTATPELDRTHITKAIDNILKLDRDSLSLNNFLRRKYLKLYKKYAHSKKCPLRCQALSSSCLLEPQGDLYPCGIFAQRIANVIEENYDLEKIWSYPDTKILSAKCRKSECPSCWSPCDAYSAIAGSLGSFDLWR